MSRVGSHIKHLDTTGKFPDLTIQTHNGRTVNVLESLDEINLYLEVISEVMDEIIEKTNISELTIQQRVEGKLMLRKLSS